MTGKAPVCNALPQDTSVTISASFRRRAVSAVLQRERLRGGEGRGGVRERPTAEEREKERSKVKATRHACVEIGSGQASSASSDWQQFLTEIDQATKPPRRPSVVRRSSPTRELHSLLAARHAAPITSPPLPFSSHSAAAVAAPADARVPTPLRPSAMSSSLTCAPHPPRSRSRHPVRADQDAASRPRARGNAPAPRSSTPPHARTPAFLIRFRRRKQNAADPVTSERLESANDPVSARAAAVEFVRHGKREFFIERPSSSTTPSSSSFSSAGGKTVRRGGAAFRPGDALRVRETSVSRGWRGKLVDGVKRWAFPAGYPHSVGPGFVEYTRWRLSAFFFGGAVGVFSTQGLLLAVGVGRQSAAPLAAALQWVIRDGMGRAGRMLFSQVGNGFDAETKQYRLMAALVLNLSCALESVTPAVPTLFLPVACLANMAKGASTVAAASTRSAIYRSFMRRENLGDITAKQETVGVMGDLMGTAMGIVLSRLTANNGRAAMSAFVGVSLAHLFSVYREIKGIQLGTLNRQRAHMLIKYYLEEGKVPNLRAGNRNERILNRPWLDSLHAPNIDLGARLHECAPDAEALQYLLKLYKNERYLFTYEGTRLKIVLRNDAGSHDCLKGFLQADYFWRRYLEVGERESRNRDLVEESYRFANRRFEGFVKEADQNGWVTKSVLLRPIGRRASWNNSSRVGGRGSEK